MSGEWAPVPYLGSPGFFHTPAFDPKSNRLYSYEGYRDGHHLWTMRPGLDHNWQPIEVGGTPPMTGTLQEKLFCDAPRNRLILFAPLSPSTEPDRLWSVSLEDPTWTVLETQGDVPPQDSSPVMVADPKDSCLIRLGADRTDVIYKLSLTEPPTWKRIDVAGPYPAGRSNEGIAYLPERDAIVMAFGTAGNERFTDVWLLHLSGEPAWESLAVEGAGPSPRILPNLGYDPVSDRLVLFSGQAYRESDTFEDLWTLDLAGPHAWTRSITPHLQPQGRMACLLEYDPAGGRLLLFGGWTWYHPVDRSVWSLAFDGGAATWTWLAGAPNFRSGETAILDPIRRRFVVFGGEEGEGIPLNDLWSFSLDEGYWTWWPASEGGPSPRSNHSAIYDPVRDRMIIFGGETRDEDGRFRTFNDTWACRLSDMEWSPMETRDPPSSRSHHVAVYDPLKDRMIVLAGSAHTSTPCPGQGFPYPGYRGDAQSLSLSPAFGLPDWRDLPQIPWEGPFEGFAAAFEPGRNGLILVGGMTYRPCYPGQDLRVDYFNDVRRFLLEPVQLWTINVPIVSENLVRHRTTIAYDPFFNRFLTLGGVGPDEVPTGSLISLEAPDAYTLRWTRFTETGPVMRPFLGRSMFFDPVTESVWTLFGRDDGATLWRFRIDQEPPVVAQVQETRAEPDHVRLTWCVVPEASRLVKLYRRGADREWRLLSPLAADHSGQVVYDDTNVSPGQTWDYRLSVTLRNTVMAAGDVSQTVPVPEKMSLGSLYPNPAISGFTVPLDLNRPGPATIQMFDVQGREIWNRDLGWLTTGRHLIPVHRPSGTASGNYYVRITQGSVTLIAHLVLLGDRHSFAR